MPLVLFYTQYISRLVPPSNDSRFMQIAKIWQKISKECVSWFTRTTKFGQHLVVYEDRPNKRGEAVK